MNKRIDTLISEGWTVKASLWGCELVHPLGSYSTPIATRHAIHYRQRQATVAVPQRQLQAAALPEGNDPLVEAAGPDDIPTGGDV